MPTLVGPFSVGYPVAFRSGGDTTREAFNKHIERIYGILNSLDSGKLTTTDMLQYLNEHKNSTNPHPNWKINLSDLAGNIDGSKITGSISGANIPAANVIGKLTQATIDAAKVNGLEDFINGLSGDDIDKGDGIVESQLNASGGYVKFGNGLIAQWAKNAKASNVEEGRPSQPFKLTYNLLKSLSSSYYVIFMQDAANSNNDLVFRPNANAMRHSSYEIGKTSIILNYDASPLYYSDDYSTLLSYARISYFLIGQ